MKTFEPGDKVVFTSEKLHQEYPSFFPPAGTVGTILSANCRGEYDVQWPDGSTSKDDQWIADQNDLEKEG